MSEHHPITTSDEDSIVGKITSVKHIQDFLTNVINLNQAGNYYEPTCKVCTSALRERGEKYYGSLDPLNKHKDEALSSWFASEGEDIPLDAVKNHTSNHVGVGDREYRKIEYINRVSNLCSVQLDPLQRLDFAIAAITDRITEMSSHSQGNMLHEDKRSKIMNDLFKTYGSLLEQQNKLIQSMEEEGKLVRIPRDEFNSVFKKHMDPLNEEERERLLELLEDLDRSSISS